MAEFTHFKKDGSAVMVDVHEKPDTYRVASATGTIQVSPEVFAAVRNHTAKKGDVLGVARLAGIMGAKKNAEHTFDHGRVYHIVCRKDRCGDGGTDRGFHRAAYHLRYVQGDGPRHGDS